MGVSFRIFFATSVCVAFGSLPAAASILPKNNLKIYDGEKYAGGMSKEEFDKTIDSVAKPYFERAEKYGATLVVEKAWEVPEINAAATQKGDEWRVIVWGGLARHPIVSKDALALTVCHELGHHFGGYPFYELSGTWASAEGQADYFATQSCLREAWKNEQIENAKAAEKVEPIAKTSCDAQWSNTTSRHLCYRISTASREIALLIAELEKAQKLPEFATPDTTRQRYNTNKYHPRSQCRLDTFFQGALCVKNFSPEVIPGKKHAEGQESKAAEGQALLGSCSIVEGDKVGARPGCWFHPQVEFDGLRFYGEEYKEVDGNGNGVIEPGEAFALGVVLKNYGTTPIGMSKVELTAPTKDLGILKGETQLDSLSPREAKGPEPFLFKVHPGVACGDTLSWDLSAWTKGGGMITRRDLFVGDLKEYFIGSNKTEVNIPDGKKDGIYTAIRSEFDGPSHAVTISVRLQHEFPSDVLLIAESPEGKGIFLAKLDGENGRKEINKTFYRSAVLPSAKGEWRLWAVDEVSSRSGKLLQWDLKVHSPECR